MCKLGICKQIIYGLKVESKINESATLKMVISEGKSERCSRETNESIRFIFNINPRVKEIFKMNGINKMMKEVFPENFYENNEFAPGENVRCL
jgi:hypothetical protein